MDRKRKAAEESKEAGCTNEEQKLVASSEDQPNVVTPHSSQTQSYDTSAKRNLAFEMEKECRTHDEASAEETDMKPEPKSGSKPETQNPLPHGDEEEDIEEANEEEEEEKEKERKALECEDQGSEVFTSFYWTHIGKTFKQVAKDDPSYHLRFKYKRPGPDPVIDKYIAWFDRWGPGPDVANIAYQKYLADNFGKKPDLIMDRKRKEVEQQSKEVGCTNEEPELVGSSEDQPKVIAHPSSQTPSSAKKQRFDDAEDLHDGVVKLEPVGPFDEEEEATARDEASAEEVAVKSEPKSGNVLPETDQSPLPEGGSQEKANEEEEASEEDEDQDDKGDKKEKELTGDTEMGFGMYKEETCRDVMISHYDYIRWGRSQEKPTGELARFLKWTNSDEGKALEGEGQGNEKFTTYSKQHTGETFRQVAKDDPSYHLRFKHMRPGPDPVLDRYSAWFDRWGPGPEAAELALQEYLAQRRARSIGYS
jgi:hypothetical protein